ENFPDKRNKYNFFLDEIEEKGWPKKNQEIGRWVDQIFQGEWIKMVQKAAQLPLGMFQDPRLTDILSGQFHGEFFNMGRLLMVRALQVQAWGESQKALNILNTA